MRKLTICFAGLVLALGVAAMADDTKQPDAGQGMEGMPMMGPGPEMKKLVPQMVGTWDCEMSFRMNPADTNWMVSKGTAKWEAILGGCVLQQTYDSPMMGMAYQGMSWLGYSAEEKKYRQTWADNMGGNITYYTGTMDGDKMIMEGQDLYQGKTFLVRMTSVTAKPGTVLWTMEMSEDGGKTYYESMKATYTKKQ